MVSEKQTPRYTLKRGKERVALYMPYYKAFAVAVSELDGHYNEDAKAWVFPVESLDSLLGALSLWCQNHKEDEPSDPLPSEVKKELLKKDLIPIPKTGNQLMKEYFADLDANLLRSIEVWGTEKAIANYNELILLWEAYVEVYGEGEAYNAIVTSVQKALKKARKTDRETPSLCKRTVIFEYVTKALQGDSTIEDYKNKLYEEGKLFNEPDKVQKEAKFITG